MSVLSPLYRDTVTLFNRFVDDSGNISWIPTVLNGTHFVVSKSVLVATYGENSSDSAMLNVPYQLINGKVMIGRKKYLPPKQYSKLDIDSAMKSITFTAGLDFDFIFGDIWPQSSPIADADYKTGFFQYMKTNFEDVYAITDTPKYNVIKKFAIVAR